MFKKNDSLVDSVRAVMEVSEFDRQIEAAVNEEFGISSRKGLPHELKYAYEQRLEEVKKCMYEGKPLVGNQHKLDVANKQGEAKPDGQLSSHDFKLLRKKKKMMDEKWHEEANVAPGKKPITTPAKGAKKALEEKLTKSMSAGDVISDFVHSDDPKFKGKSTKERQKMALDAYYGMHSEKSRKQVDEGKQEQSITGAIGKDVSGFGQRAKAGLQRLGGEISGDVQSGLGKLSYGAQKVFDFSPNVSKYFGNVGKSYDVDAAKTIKQSKDVANKTLQGAMDRGEISKKVGYYKEDIEALWEEMRFNLEEQLLAIYESGDEAAFEYFVENLTEEECEILGLNEIMLKLPTGGLAAKGVTGGVASDLGKLGIGKELPASVPKPEIIKPSDVASSPRSTTKFGGETPRAPGKGELAAQRQADRFAAKEPAAPASKPAAAPASKPAAAPSGKPRDIDPNWFEKNKGTTIRPGTKPGEPHTFETPKSTSSSPSATAGGEAAAQLDKEKFMGKAFRQKLDDLEKQKTLATAKQNKQLRKTFGVKEKKTFGQKLKTAAKWGGAGAATYAAYKAFGGGSGDSTDKKGGSAAPSNEIDMKDQPSGTKVWKGTTPTQVKLMKKHNYRSLPKSASAADETMKSLDPRWEMDHPLPKLKESFEQFIRNKFLKG